MKLIDNINFRLFKFFLNLEIVFFIYLYIYIKINLLYIIINLIE